MSTLEFWPGLDRSMTREEYRLSRQVSRTMAAIAPLRDHLGTKALADLNQGLPIYVRFDGYHVARVPHPRERA